MSHSWVSEDSPSHGVPPHSLATLIFRSLVCCLSRGLEVHTSGQASQAPHSSHSQLTGQQPASHFLVLLASATSQSAPLFLFFHMMSLVSCSIAFHGPFGISHVTVSSVVPLFPHDVSGLVLYRISWSFWHQPRHSQLRCSSFST